MKQRGTRRSEMVELLDSKFIFPEGLASEILDVLEAAGMLPPEWENGDAKYIESLHGRLDDRYKELIELKAELKEKQENGCCFVEHGYRMEAEHKLQAKSEECAKLREALLLLVTKEGAFTEGNENWDNAREALKGQP